VRDEGRFKDRKTGFITTFREVWVGGAEKGRGLVNDDSKGNEWLKKTQSMQVKGIDRGSG